MSILVTGGLGYIGSHVCVTLIEKGHDIIILDDLSNSKKEVLISISKISGVVPRFYQCSLLDVGMVRNIFIENNVSSVIHLAGLKSITESFHDPLKYYHQNLNSTTNLLHVMSEFSVSNLIFSSSASVYGEQENSPLLENYKKNPCNVYSKSKSIIEDICFDISHANSNWSIVSLRYFNPIGAHRSGLLGENPRTPPTNIMPLILSVARAKTDCLEIYGSDYPTSDGTCIRDFIHVSDLADGHLAALNYSQANNGYVAINLGTGFGISILELVKTFAYSTGAKIPTKFSRRREGDLAIVYASAEKAFKLLGWKSSRSLEEMCIDSFNSIQL